LQKPLLSPFFKPTAMAELPVGPPPPPHTRTQNQPRPSGFLLHAIALHICTGIDESSQYMFDSPGSEELEAGQEICLLLCSSMPVLA